MSVLERNFMSVALSEAGIAYTYNDEDDIKSLRRWLHRELSPLASDTAKPGEGEPWLFIEPLEGSFRRPAITIRLLPSTVMVTQGHASSNYSITHSLIFTAYGNDHAETIAIGQSMFRMMTEGSAPARARFRIPMWGFDLRARLARMMRVVPDSISMDLAETNEQGEWSRAMECRVVAPRVRFAPGAPSVQVVGHTGTVSR